ncbi:MAG: hypothetical protein A3E82_04280 [Gammaproteobacteria bacterium RIFCSPHIGHO2_12_FULL_38_11]|nr:MAG: hypothetical protein A3E82_04280 [Gammaproteobacteria bacterium RIFCSPHIGHO2_12_FULL_38_11]
MLRTTNIGSLFSPRQPRESLPVKLPCKANANALSHVFMDMVISGQHFNLEELEGKIPVGVIVPQVFIQGFSPENCRAVREENFQFFQTGEKRKRLLTLLEAREEKFLAPYNEIVQNSRLSFEEQFLSDGTPEKKYEDFIQFLTKVLNYREKIESAIFATSQQFINCAEHAAMAFVNELFSALQKECKQVFHFVHPQSSKTPANDHVYLVCGSTTLKPCSISADVNGVKNILAEMDGTIIDYWNNPMAGGVKLPAAQARAQFNQYGPLVAEIWDSITVEEFSAKEIHDEIEQSIFSQKEKDFLMKYAGPRLTDVMMLGIAPLSDGTSTKHFSPST